MDLHKAFAEQKKMRARLEKERGIKWTDEQWMLQFITCITDELSELRAELNWKHWKNTKPLNYDNIRGEVADLWIFLIELTISAGMSVEDVEAEFIAKTKENHARQDGTSAKRGYAAGINSVNIPIAAVLQQVTAEVNLKSGLHERLQQDRKR